MLTESGGPVVRAVLAPPAQDAGGTTLPGVDGRILQAVVAP